MIRKQFYIAPEQQRKLRSLAKRWKCTEAEVVRAALDRLEEPAEDAVLERLREAGLLVEPRNDPDLPLKTPEEIAELERQWDEIVRSLPHPLGLAEAVLEDRR